MHGVRRSKQTPQAIATRKEQEKAEIKSYLALSDEVLGKKKLNDWSKDAFELTQRVLRRNPEFYTVWNYRRQIMLNGLFPHSTPEDINFLLSEELKFTSLVLRTNPKVYWIWNHRRWCLANIPEGPIVDDNTTQGWRQAAWDGELALAEKMLEADARNFHAWSYRRYILADMPAKRPEATELAYTKKKIQSSMSNFSAWHQRSKTYTALWQSGALAEGKFEPEEFDLVHSALWTDPADQSAWIYHRWLIGQGKDRAILEAEISLIEELLQEEPNSKWCMESLVHYKRLLLRNHEPQSSELLNSCRELLQRLQTIDPPRKQRYRDIELELSA
ncbi:rab-protein geranylgeranyltransferase [Coniophora puteana RWD-64-598 SS2]|uniref:Geranylgeranyl transferase type-2 subunit alpha n=1 Tax=Coniophora puteana (strain RWD-64-598) TaxID=741705 RepID=A0A5M3N1X7_CONPW|nr:rab-protein geranylgeranyltransferase [Coniophora puteana RWD-64-598 SS2]EIW85393.1 rab-protein geranylgeranyltransferase [Coniophora puteana RWD-64-598 SS2]